MKKKGQFYLLAAIVIIGVLVGFVAILNYGSKTSTINLYDLRENLGIESEAVMDYVKIHGENGEVEEFTEYFDTYVGQDAEVYFVTNSEAYFYDEDGNPTEIPHDASGDKIIVELEGETYEFDKKPGDNFYFVIRQEIGGELYVVTN